MSVFVHRNWVPFAVAFLLAIMAAAMAYTVHGQSLTWDEDDHLFAGYMSLKTGDFGLNPEHPPMAKMVAALPLLPLQLKTPPLQNRFFKIEAYLDGGDMLFRNGQYSGQTLLFRARLATMIFPLTLGLLVFFATREMFQSSEVAVLALLLFVFEPNILAHGAYVTTDAAISCFFFSAAYTLYRWFKQPTVPRLLAVALVCGLALASKHSAIVLLPVLLALMVGELFARWRQQKENLPRFTAKLAGAFAVIAIVAVAILWAFYGFRYAARPAGLALDPTLASYVNPLKPMEAKGILLFARFHLLPESYLYGLTDVRSMANAMPSFVLGKVYAHGVWFYFPLVLAIKLTLGFLALVGISIYATAAGRIKRPREVFYLLAPPLIYLAVAMGSNLNIGMRHVLPMTPFLIVLAAGCCWTLAQRDRGWRIAVLVLIAAHCLSSALAFPHDISYANEAFGGRSKTNRYLSDSNTDWAQQLIVTKKYLDAHNIHDCWIAYFAEPFVLTTDYGIPCKVLPTADSMSVFDLPDPPMTIHGPVLISYGTLNGFEMGSKIRNPLQSFYERKPDDVIDDGIAVYNGDFAIPEVVSLGQASLSQHLLKKHMLAESLKAAQAAVATDANYFDAQESLGDALAANGDKAHAVEAYRAALAIAQQMEPQAKEQYSAELQKKIVAL